MMMSSSSLSALSTALSLAQGKLEDAAKSSFNPGFKSKYADLATVLQAIRPILAAEGLSFVQGTSYTDGLATVTTRLMHKSGEYIEDALNVPVTKKDAQGLGSALTYGRRYALSAMVGLSQDDDDGNASTGKKAETKVTSTDAGPKVSKAALATRYDLVSTPAELEALTKEFSKLQPAEQAAVLPNAKAARARISPKA